MVARHPVLRSACPHRTRSGPTMNPVPYFLLPRRIDIELTCELEDGSWTWRQAGARAPRGVLDAELVPADATVGVVVRAEVESEIGGGSIVISVLTPRARERHVELIELSPAATFEPVVQNRADREKPKRSTPRKVPKERSRARDFAPPPPELPRRPAPKRLREGDAHRRAVLDVLSPLHRTVAETAVKGGMKAVREAVARQNTQLKEEGKPEIDAENLVSLVQELTPRLRVAAWLDRAESALRDIEELDLRDLRSVVVMSDDPMVRREEQTRPMATQLREALRRRERVMHETWLSDITTAVGVGRLIRALKLSSEPPKAGQPFPKELGDRLAAAATADLNATNPQDRWVAVLEAVAFSPVKSAVRVTSLPNPVSEELTKTISRLAVAIPAVALSFGVVAPPGATQPRPLRVQRPDARKAAGRRDRSGRDRGNRRGSAPRSDASASAPPAGSEPTGLQAQPLA